MQNPLEALLAWWAEGATPRPGCFRYDVTPRQGRHTVRRKLLRALKHRFVMQRVAVPASAVKKLTNPSNER